MAYQKNNNWLNNRPSNFNKIKRLEDVFECVFIKRKNKLFARPIIFRGIQASKEWLRQFKELNPNWKEGEEW